MRSGDMAGVGLLAHDLLFNPHGVGDGPPGAHNPNL
jgi:hypothetical protein